MIDTIYGKPFTPGEQPIYEKALLLWSNQQIADHLGLAKESVVKHMTSIYKKLGLKTVMQKRMFRALPEGRTRYPYVKPSPNQRAFVH
jgi:DNA-binding NarL/FixJ family response regulator